LLDIASVFQVTPVRAARHCYGSVMTMRVRMGVLVLQTLVSVRLVSTLSCIDDL